MTVSPVMDRAADAVPARPTGRDHYLAWCWRDWSCVVWVLSDHRQYLDLWHQRYPRHRYRHPQHKKMNLRSDRTHHTRSYNLSDNYRWRHDRIDRLYLADRTTRTHYPTETAHPDAWDIFGDLTSV